MHKLKIPVKNASPDLRQYLNNLRHKNSQNINHLYFGSNEYSIIATLSLLGGLGFLWWAYKSHDIMMAPNYQWKAMLICSLGIIAVSYAMHFFLFTITSSNYLGEFECIDGERWWTITPYDISLIDLAGLSNVDGTHILEGGQYKKTEITLTYNNTTLDDVIIGKEKAEKIINFLTSLTAIKNPRALDFSLHPSHTTSIGFPTAIFIALIAINFFIIPQISLAARDNSLFINAKEDLDSTKDISSIRAYLNDMHTSRHRAEATLLIQAQYASAIDKLKTQGLNLYGEQRILNKAFILLLEKLKSENSPNVYIEFDAKIAESIKTAESTQMNRDGVTPLGEIFTKENMEVRQLAIIRILENAIGSTLEKGIINFKECPSHNSDAKCQITIKYTINPSGSTYFYQKNGETGSTSRLLGLQINWGISFHEINQGKDYQFNLNSQPLLHLKMRSDGTEPDWAPYAVMLYSAFHEFSGNLTSGFGLKTAETPNSFSFRDAIGERKTIAP